jgi:hypothetical protein
MYLSATTEAISAVLLAERGPRKKPIYFISRALQGPEVNYDPMEKLVLATRILKRYFQAHPVVVITDQPIKQVLAQIEKTGRMTKWAIELGAHDINYRPRMAIKGQVLADFITEVPEEGSSATTESAEKLPYIEPWNLYTDGSSCQEGSGAGLILTNPEGTEFTYALRFEFDTSNNEAEYEALLAGLWIAEKIGVKDISANVDSRLVANQINGTYVAKEKSMIRYLAKSQALI